MLCGWLFWNRIVSTANGSIFIYSEGAPNLIPFLQLYNEFTVLAEHFTKLLQIKQ